MIIKNHNIFAAVKAFEMFEYSADVQFNKYKLNLHLQSSKFVSKKIKI